MCFLSCATRKQPVGSYRITAIFTFLNVYLNLEISMGISITEVNRPTTEFNTYCSEICLSLCGPVGFNNGPYFTYKDHKSHEMWYICVL